MSQTDAKIDMSNSPGVVVNVQVVDSGDPLDPNFTWVNIDGMSPQPGIGWTYDGANFSPPPSPPTDWEAVLEGDIGAIQDLYLQSLSDYAAAVTAGHTTDANNGITAGIADASGSYTPNEEGPFTTFVGLISTGG